MGLFGDLGNFFKNAANKVSSTIIKPIGHFVSNTIPDVAGKVISAIKSGGSKAIVIRIRGNCISRIPHLE